MCRVPQDINPDSSAKSALVDNESPKVDKPPSPQTEKTMPESPSPKSARGSPGNGGAPSSPSRATSCHNPVGTSSGSEPDEFPEASPPSSRSYGLETAHGYQPGEGSSVPQSEKQS
jgi:hypothetical protein